MRRLSARAWAWLFGLYSYGMTVVCSAWFLRRLRLERGEVLEVGTSLLWSALLYGGWAVPLAGIWLIYRRMGARASTYLALAALGLVAIPGHAAFSVWIDGQFSGAGMAGFARAVEHRLPVAILIYSALCAAGLAIRLQGDKDRLARALEAARGAAAVPPAATPERLMVSAGSRRVVVDPAEIEWLGSAGNYVVVYWQGREGLIRETLQAMEGRLDGRVFARAHRSAIVNLAKVKDAASLSDGSWRLTTESGSEVVVSRTYRDAVLGRLGK
jgi:DNA-binding LytR/AlgR family response regulator